MNHPLSLPTGTVTFLFTDIEGSTKNWEAHPEEMRAALARHDALLQEVAEGAGGVVFKTVGDAFYVAFPSPADALSATIEAQRRIQDEPWPAVTQIRVRMALHTGVAEFRDNDYFGTVLNRVSRLLSTGHGGQALLSAATYELVRDHLSEPVALRDLGMHRLKDLDRPEQVFQLLHPDLPADFPPLRSLDNPDLPNNLPRQLTSFIGREQQIADVTALLAKTSLLTLMGAGGSGKTRLSLQVAADVLDEYPHGAYLIELAALTDPALLGQTLAQTLGIKEQPGQSIVQTLTEQLKGKCLLILLDNCEHLVRACAQLATALLRACPRVRLLATSREALGIAGEQTYRVPSLSLPAPSSTLATPESLNQYEAVRLFIERALLVKPDFAVTNTNAPALAQLCHRLDGIPLALELAAARIRSLSVEDINARLDSRFRLLTGGDRSALPRQQTLRALVDWSYDLLGDSERVLLARLSVFSGGWTLEAVEAVCGFDPIEDWEVLDLLTNLVDKSIVLTDLRDDGATRYRMLETLRQYAVEKRKESDESATLQERHGDFFLALAEEAEPKQVGPEQAVWLNRLEAEHDNLRGALTLSENSPSILRLSAALWWFWYVRGYFTEGRECLDRALSQARDTGESTARIRALTGAGVLAYSQGEPMAARSLLEECLALSRNENDSLGAACTLNHLGRMAVQQGDYGSAGALLREGLEIGRTLEHKLTVAFSLNELGNIAREQGDTASAKAHYDEVHSLYQELGDRIGIAYALNNLGNIALGQDDAESARVLFQQALSHFRELGDTRGIAVLLTNLGSIAASQDDNRTAQGLHEESLSLCRQSGDKRGMTMSLSNLGLIAIEEKDFVAARTLLHESLRLSQELGDKLGIAYSLEDLATTAWNESLFPRAVVLWAAADALRERSQMPLPSGERIRREEKLAQARDALSEEGTFSSAWDEGRAMDLEQAITYALNAPN